MQVYLDNGATTKVAKEVNDEMSPYFNEKYGNASSLHKWGRDARNAIEKAREQIAESINAEAGEIIFTSGGTESNNLAIKGAAFSQKTGKNHIIISRIEHDCVLNSSKFLEKQGFKVTYIGVDNYGFIDPKELERSITDKTFLVSLMHANNEIGTILQLEKYGKICREKGILFHTDACQSYTKVPIDVKSMNIDMMTLNAHKIHGPKGVGALYIRKGVKIVPWQDGGGHEFGKRSGTENVPGIIGFAKSIGLLTQAEKKKMEELRDHLITELLKIPETHLNGHPIDRLCNNANISFHFIEGESLLMHLDMRGIAVSTGSACSSHSLEPSHVLLAVGLKHEVAHGTIRFTLSRYTTKEEIEYTIKNVIEVVDILRQMSPMKKGMKYDVKEVHHH